MPRIKQLAFTLIELLVVIAIIGILSGLIVVSMNGITQKATIAKSQVFANSLRNSLMLNLVSEWKFDGAATDGTTATNNDVLDTWSGLNNGSVTVPVRTHTPTVRTGSNCVSGSCLEFNGAADYVDCGSGTTFNNLSQITISAWAISNPSANYRTVISKGYHTAGSWEIRMNRDSEGSNLNFGVVTAGGRIASAIPNFSNSTWHNIVAVYDGIKTYIYDNGVLIDSDPQTGSIINTADTVKIGQNGVNNEYWNGKIDDVRIFNAAMSTSQIKEEYFVGLNKLFVNGGITKEEYLSRLNNYAKN